MAKVTFMYHTRTAYSASSGRITSSAESLNKITTAMKTPEGLTVKDFAWPVIRVSDFGLRYNEPSYKGGPLGSGKNEPNSASGVAPPDWQNWRDPLARD